MQFQNIKTIFFDLDNTLFDHSYAEKAALTKMMKSRPVMFAEVDMKQFIDAYHKVNVELWQRLQRKEISASQLRISRFQETCRQFDILEGDFQALSDSYLEHYTRLGPPVSGMHEILNYLKRAYPLGLLTNGFTTTQKGKLERLGLTGFFEFEVFSEDVGAMKPSELIFERAMQMSRSSPDDIVYIGDNYESDVIGARNVGWQAILFLSDNSIPEDEFPDADRVIRTLPELTRYF